MRKTLALLLTAAFVASIPSVASAKKYKRHKHPRHAVTQPMYQDNPGPRFVGNALYQLVVPWEQTFGTRHYR